MSVWLQWPGWKQHTDSCLHMLCNVAHMVIEFRLHLSVWVRHQRLPASSSCHARFFGTLPSQRLRIQGLCTSAFSTTGSLERVYCMLLLIITCAEGFRRVLGHEVSDDGDEATVECHDKAEARELNLKSKTRSLEPNWMPTCKPPRR